MTDTHQLIEALPKAELHVHLEGSLEPELLFDLAKRNEVDIGYGSVEELRGAYVFDNLQEFLDIYYVGMQVLLTRQDFYDLAMAYFREARKNNVRHVEAFFDPQAHVERGVSLETVVQGLVDAVNDAQQLAMSISLIPCLLRHLPAAVCVQAAKDLRPFKEHFVAVGLDSSELGHPPSNFIEAFDQVRDMGLKVVAHAGEEGPPSYVWQAIDDLRVNRIDHGNRALEDMKLVSSIVERSIPLTVCPLSNLKLQVVPDLKEHPIRRMLDLNLIATVNSDDPAYFGGYMNENFHALDDALNLRADEVIQLAKNSFIASFLPPKTIADWLREIDAQANQIR